MVEGNGRGRVKGLFWADSCKKWADIRMTSACKFVAPSNIVKGQVI